MSKIASKIITAGTGLLAAGLLCLPAQARMERAYIGTFTNNNPERPSQMGNRAEGIYVTALDTETGRLTTPRLAAKTASPSWLIIDRKRGVLYACNYYHGFAGGTGSVSAFRIGKDGDLALINQVSAGDAPAQIVLDPGGNWLLAGSYDAGSLAVLPVHADGSLGDYTDLIHPEGAKGPDQAADQPPGNQATSNHAHSRLHGVTFDPSGKYVVTHDAGLDVISVFTLDSAAGKLSKVADYPQTPGSAPRHGIFDATGRILYTVFEQNSKVSVSDFDPASGVLRQRQMLSILPPGFGGTSTGAEILFSKDRKSLYVSTRYHDSVARFAVAADGSLAWRSDTLAGANFVRGLAIDPGGTWMLAMGQYGDNVSTLRLDADGEPHVMGLYAPVPSPVAMVFEAP